MRYTIILLMIILFGCNNKEDPVLLEPDNENYSDSYNFDNCETSISSDVPSFFLKYFECVTITMSESGEYINLYYNGLPPYSSWYYEEENPNYTDWYSQGQGYFQIPNAYISEVEYVISIPVNPEPREGLEIGSYEVDGEVGYPLEYPLGSVGAALNGVSIFNPLASPPDVIEDEAYSFDLYSGHPAGPSGIYHYHTTSAGPLEVLEHKGLISETTPGIAEIEVYGIMCDGTVILGCTELDGSQVNLSDWDAQNGHIHDMIDEDGITHFENRYHTHICYDSVTEADTDGNGFQEHEFTPEISFYRTPGYSNDYVCGASNVPLESNVLPKGEDTINKK